MMLKGGPPLMATSWAGKTGISEAPPEGPEWFDWGRRVKVDTSKLHNYGQAVFASTDAYIASLKESDYSRIVQTPAGQMSVLQMVTIVSHHMRDFAGEISCLKDLQGLKGYPV